MARDNAYYLRRLESEHPKHFADLKAGRYRSPREAFIAAGLKKERTPLHELKNAWKKASLAERRNFIAWVRGSAMRSPTGPVANKDRRLEPWAKARFEHIRTARGMNMNGVKDELGMKHLNVSIEWAMQRGTTLQPSVITAIEKWFAANASV